jgi:hypothetical protein
VTIDTKDCWLSPHPKEKNGYVRVVVRNRKRELVHRLSYVLFYRRIPNGKQIDHLCRVRHCFNPKHLEAVWPKENLLRGQGACAINARKKVCIRGHKFSKRTSYNGSRGERVCKVCKKILARKYRELNRDKGN